MTGSNHMNSAAFETKILDGGWRWVIVFSSFMIHFIMDGITYSMSDIYLRPMMEVLHSNRGRVSTIFAILPAVTFVSGPIATALVNIYGYQKITIVGGCIAALGFFASSFYANIWLYYIAIGIIGGFGFGLIYISAIVSVNSYFEPKPSFAIGIAVCGSGLGTMVFPWIMPYIIHSPVWFDYDGALLSESAIIFICVIFGILMIPLPNDHSEKRRIEKKSRAAAKQSVRQVVTSDDTTVNIDEPRNHLLSNHESAPFRETKESSIVVPSVQQPFTDYECRVSVLDAKQNESTNESDYNNDRDKILSKSREHASSKTAAETPAFDEYYPKMITTSDRETVQSTDKKTEIVPNHSFIYELGKQLELNVLQDRIFVLFVISNFLTSLGLYVPYNFANDLAIDANIDEHRRHWIIMSIGISNCFGRVISGILAACKGVNHSVLYIITLIIAGMATIVALLCGSLIYLHMGYASLFGFFSGGFVTLTPVIVPDLVGQDKFANALGILSLFQGIAIGLSTPIVGVMRDAYSNFSQPYLWPYLIFGSSIVLSGIILFPMPSLIRRRKRYQK